MRRRSVLGAIIGCAPVSGEPTLRPAPRFALGTIHRVASGATTDRRRARRSNNYRSGSAGASDVRRRPARHAVHVDTTTHRSSRPRRIVAGFDATDAGLDAVALGRQLAETTGAVLVVTHVYSLNVV